jgi:hypothetical protein
MHPKRTIRREYGIIEVFSDSIRLNGIEIATPQDPELGSFIYDLDLALTALWMGCVKKTKQDISRKFSEFLEAIAG